MKKFFFYPILLILSFNLFSCEDKSETTGALLNIILVDTPAKWDSVFVEIDGVEVELLANGRESLSTKTYFFEYKSGDKRIKISDLVGGNALLIGRDQLPLGTVTKITPKVGTENTMFYNGKKYFLTLKNPEGMDVPLITDLKMDQGTSYDLLLDMDLEKSIIEDNEDAKSYSLDPSFSVIKGADTGILEGLIQAKSLYPAVFLMNDTDTLSTHLSPAGKYYFRAPAGKYTVYIDPKDEAYQDTTFSADIETRIIKEVENITLKSKP